MTIPWIEFDKSATPIHISLEPGDARLSPWGDHDTVIIRKIGDKQFDALVPTWSVAEDRSYVMAARVGRAQGKIVVYLATSNEGRPAWRLTDAEYAQVATKAESN